MKIFVYITLSCFNTILNAQTLYYDSDSLQNHGNGTYENPLSNLMDLMNKLNTSSNVTIYVIHSFLLNINFSFTNSNIVFM